MGIFKNNKDLDSTIIVAVYGTAVLMHMLLTAFVKVYADAATAPEITEWIQNIGLVIVGSLFRRQGETKGGRGDEGNENAS